MSELLTYYDLPTYWQSKISSIKAENRNLRTRLKIASAPGDNRDKLKDLVGEARGLRTRLRAAEARIAELEAAASNV